MTISMTLVDRIRQSLQVIICENGNVRLRAEQLGIVDNDVVESVAAVERAVMRIEADMVAEILDEEWT